VDHAELSDQFQDFEPEVQALLKVRISHNSSDPSWNGNSTLANLKCIDKSSRWAIYDLEPLAFWSKGRVTLLGDAASNIRP
jgi:salicylate hydroxylase